MRFLVRFRPLAFLVAGLTAATTFGGPAASAAADPAPVYAPVDRPGPGLTLSQSELASSLVCTANLRTSTTQPVLLLSGTTINPAEEFDWTWEPALRDHGIPYCISTYRPALHNMDDISRRGEAVVWAIRHMHRASGKKVRILGHSQGGMVGRWALRFWPDTRRMVASVIGLSPSNHGTLTTPPICLLTCQAALWQQARGSRFLAALNSGQETFPGITYTVIFTHLDEVVLPGRWGSLNGPATRVRNYATQDICPLNLAEHLQTGSTDAVTYALAYDALTHGGLADESRIDRRVCRNPLMPYVRPGTLPLDGLRAGTSILYGLTFAGRRLSEEPTLPCYVYAAGC